MLPQLRKALRASLLGGAPLHRADASFSVPRNPLHLLRGLLVIGILFNGNNLFGRLVLLVVGLGQLARVLLFLLGCFKAFLLRTSSDLLFRNEGVLQLFEWRGLDHVDFRDLALHLELLLHLELVVKLLLLLLEFLLDLL